jgi:hypothetical protein
VYVVFCVYVPAGKVSVTPVPGSAYVFGLLGMDATIPTEVPLSDHRNVVPVPAKVVDGGVAAAPLVPPVKVIVGAELYPEPTFVTTTPVTWPPEIVAYPDAVIPVGEGVKATAGGDV